MWWSIIVLKQSFLSSQTESQVEYRVYPPSHFLSCLTIARLPKVLFGESNTSITFVTSLRGRLNGRRASPLFPPRSRVRTA